MAQVPYDGRRHGSEPGALTRRPLPLPANDPRNECAVVLRPTDQLQGASETLWAVAVSQLSPDDQSLLPPGDGKLQFLDSLAHQVDEQRQRYDADKSRITIRGHEYILRDTAQNVLKWIDKYKALGDNLAGMQPIYAGIPWAGFKYLMSMTMDNLDAMQALLVGLEKVSRLIDRCRVYEMLYLTCRDLDYAQGQPKVYLQDSIVRLYSSVLTFLVSAVKRYSKVRGWKKLRRATSPLGKAEVQELITTCEYDEGQVEKWVGLCNQVLDGRRMASIQEKLRGCGSLFSEAQVLIKETHQISKQMFERVQIDLRVNILQWASPIPYELLHEAARNGWTAGTCRWLLDNPRYEEWRQSREAAILWLHGHVGVGKTKLVSTVVDQLKSMAEPSPKTYGLAYFYCDRNQNDRSNNEVVLDSMIRQLALLVDKEKLSGKLCELYHNAEAGGFKSKFSQEDRLSLLAEQLRQFPQTYLVVDALDECSEQSRQDLVLALQDCIRQAKRPVKLLLSSRPEQDLKALVSSFKDARNLGISAADNMADIEIHVRSMLENPPCYGWGDGWLDEALKADIQHALVHSGEGMFQWVILQLQELFDLRGKGGVQRYLLELTKLPKDLKTAYDGIFKKIQDNKQYFRIANRAFCWMMVSRQPMTANMLLEAVSQDPKSESVQSTSVSLDELKHACRHLIRVDESRIETVCRFPHLSVREYLEKEQCTLTEAHAVVAKICLTKLIGPDLPGKVQGTLRPYDDNSICDYIAYTWPYHLHDQRVFQVEKSLSLKLQKFLGSGEQSTLAYQQWLENVWDLEPIFLDSDRTVSGYFSLLPASNPMPMIVALGLEKPLSPWWRLDPFPIKHKNSKGNSLLQVAANAGNVSSVDFLLRKGGAINEVCGVWGTALQAACRASNIDMVKLLLQRGADPTVLAGHYGSALHSCCAPGNKNLEIAVLLLDTGVNVNTVSATHGTALHVACRERSKPQFDMLIQRGANIHIANEAYGTALQHAAGSGAYEMARSLLQRGAQMNVVVGRYGTALHAACLQDSKDVAELLLQHGADTSKTDRWGRTVADLAQEHYEQAVDFQKHGLLGLSERQMKSYQWISELLQQYQGKRRILPTKF